MTSSPMVQTCLVAGCKHLRLQLPRNDTSEAHLIGYAQYHRKTILPAWAHILTTPFSLSLKWT